MANTEIGSVGRVLEDECNAACHRGYVDVGNGRKFPYEYDDWPDRIQVAYENGRFIGTHLLCNGPMPVWRGDRGGAIKVYAAAHDLARRLGPCLVGTEHY